MSPSRASAKSLLSSASKSGLYLSHSLFRCLPARMFCRVWVVNTLPVLEAVLSLPERNQTTPRLLMHQHLVHADRAPEQMLVWPRLLSMVFVSGLARQENSWGSGEASGRGLSERSPGIISKKSKLVQLHEIMNQDKNCLRGIHAIQHTRPGLATIILSIGYAFTASPWRREWLL